VCVSEVGQVSEDAVNTESCWRCGTGSLRTKTEHVTGWMSLAGRQTWPVYTPTLEQQRGMCAACHWCKQWDLLILSQHYAIKSLMMLKKVVKHNIEAGLQLVWAIVVNWMIYLKENMDVADINSNQTVSECCSAALHPLMTSISVLSGVFHTYYQTWSQGHNMQGQGQGLDLQGQGLNSRGQGGLSKQILICHYVEI